MIVFDTNILSTFAKIKRLDLLRALFANQQFAVPISVMEEIRASQQDYTKKILQDQLFERIFLTPEEKLFASTLPKSLGLAERECISICKHRTTIFVTNDAHAIKHAHQHSVISIDLATILNGFIEFRILTKEELLHLIECIEQKDRIVIKQKNVVFGD